MKMLLQWMLLQRLYKSLFLFIYKITYVTTIAHDISYITDKVALLYSKLIFLLISSLFLLL